MPLPHLFARILAIAAIAATDQAAPPASPAPESEPNFYSCSVTRTGAFGSVWYRLDVPVDGSPLYHHVQWQNSDRAEGLRLMVRSDGPAPAGGLNAFAWFQATFITSRPSMRDARIEIRRIPGEQHASGFGYAGPYQRLNPWPGGGGAMHAIETQGRWEDLMTWMHGRDFLTFALVRRDETVVATDRLDATTIAAAAGAIENARHETEAMATDYRNRCEVPGPIVVT